ncbi:hypothetical protein [Trinickia fusca]|uniref:Uncharacterized protein n=1 Tax=Trinickia fusca TaxID=2419777 RepID=A0A494XCA4_9BURK|nr:hypothetical protein [Trinickia fusca]RKP48220.1 hypothetical protein D7S89_12870 [Trinickia fusca]
MDSNSIRRKTQLLTPNQVCAELLALSVVEYSYTPSLAITVELNETGGKISDTGRGMNLIPDRGDTLPHAQRALTSIYPCRPATPEIESILCAQIWGELGSLGPMLANLSCPSLQFISQREGEVWSQSYRYATPVGPATMLGATDKTGTTQVFETAAPIDRVVIANLVDTLCTAIPGLRITLLTS